MPFVKIAIAGMAISPGCVRVAHAGPVARSSGDNTQ